MTILYLINYKWFRVKMLNIIAKYKSHWIMESLNHKIQFRNGLKCKTWLLFISITDEIISLDQKLEVRFQF